MNVTKLSLQQQISAVSLVVIIISAFLPWVSAFGYSMLGIEGDGIITLVLTLAGVAIFLLGTDLFFPAQMHRKAADITLAVLAVLTVLVGLFVASNVGSFASVGVYFTLIGGIAWAVCAVWHLVAMLNATNTRQAGQSPEPPQSDPLSAGQQGTPPQGSPRQPGSYRPPQPPGP